MRGGAAATVLDSAIWLALQSLQPRGTIVSTLSITVTYLRPMSALSDELTAQATAGHCGRTVGAAHATLRDSAALVWADATSTAVSRRLDDFGATA